MARGDNSVSPVPFKGLCMVIGGIRHQEQRFNSRSAGVSSALLFLSVGGKQEIDQALKPWVQE